MHTYLDARKSLDNIVEVNQILFNVVMSVETLHKILC